MSATAHVYPVKVFLFFNAPVSFPPGFAVTGHIDGQKNSRICVNEVLPDGLAFNEGARFFTVSSSGSTPPIFSPDLLKNPLVCAGLRPGDEVLVLNGRSVSGLDLTLIQTLFSEQSLHLTLRRDGPRPPAAASQHPAPPLGRQREGGGKHHRAKSSSGD